VGDDALTLSSGCKANKGWFRFMHNSTRDRKAVVLRWTRIPCGGRIRFGARKRNAVTESRAGYLFVRRVGASAAAVRVRNRSPAAGCGPSWLQGPTEYLARGRSPPSARPADRRRVLALGRPRLPKCNP
jgi:hypothetical protein